MTNNKHLSSQPHIGDITTQSTTNSERRNRGLSLLNQTAVYCISPSSCDQFTSLNNINLQLHASSEVSNPYSFNITKDIGFNSKTLEPESEIYTLTVGNIFSAIYGYISDKILGNGNFVGDLSPKTYKGYTITRISYSINVAEHYNNKISLYIDTAKNILPNPVLSIIDENYPQIQDIILKYDTQDQPCYLSDSIDSDLAQYFQASSTIKFRLR